MFNKKKISKLKKTISYLKQQNKELDEEICLLKTDKRDLVKQVAKLNSEIEELKYVESRNKILEKYYNLEKEPPIEVQARVRADLKVHEMEHKMLIDKLNDLHLLIHNGLAAPPVQPYVIRPW